MIIPGAFFALLFEALAGYPRWLAARIGHPVEWMGALIAWFDNNWNREHDEVERRRLMGALALVTILGIAILAGALVQWLIVQLFNKTVVHTVIMTGVFASPLLAQRALYAHVAAVAAALEEDGLEAGRTAVAHIVGRDPQTLDEAGVARAAIESLAENFSDAVVAPVFWLALGGIPAMAAYKALNTADSMIGHRNMRHQDFGRASARLDDLANVVPARLTALLLVLAGVIMPRASGRRALTAMRRDARAHRSPNAGWPEAAMAGALALALAGPRIYDGKCVDDAVMGRGGRRAVTARDIRAALRLYWIGDALLIALTGALALLRFAVF